MLIKLEHQAMRRQTIFKSYKRLPCRKTVRNIIFFSFSNVISPARKKDNCFTNPNAVLSYQPTCMNMLYLIRVGLESSIYTLFHLKAHEEIIEIIKNIGDNKK